MCLFSLDTFDFTFGFVKKKIKKNKHFTYENGKYFKKFITVYNFIPYKVSILILIKIPL